MLEEVEELLNNLKEDPNTTMQTRLAEVTATIVISNKGRGDEAAKLHQMTYREYPVWHDVRNQKMCT